MRIMWLKVVELIDRVLHAIFGPLGRGKGEK